MSKTMMDKERSHETLLHPPSISWSYWRLITVGRGSLSSVVYSRVNYPVPVNNDTLIAHEDILVKLSKS